MGVPPSPAGVVAGKYTRDKKARKGAWRMPWLREAMKDVISCEKRGVGANIP